MTLASMLSILGGELGIFKGEFVTIIAFKDGNRRRCPARRSIVAEFAL
jgi:hypothetical protein